MKVALDKMANFAVILLAGVLLSASSVIANGPDLSKLKSSGIYPRSIKNSPRDRGGGSRVLGLGSPAEWTMSKANLVAEFYTSEPLPSINRDRADRSQKNILSFFGNFNNRSSEKNSYVPAVASPQSMGPPPPVNRYKQQDTHGYSNLIASGTSYSQQAVPFDNSRNNINVSPVGGYSSPFRPVSHPQQNFVFPSGSPNSGYPHNLRPPRGPPSPPPRQFVWNPRPINGLRPPPVVPSQQQQQQYQPPPPLYLPPQHSQSPRPQSQSQGPSSPPSPIPRPQAAPQNSPQPQPQPALPPQNNNSAFTPSPQYLPIEHTRVTNSPSPPHFQPASPPPQIVDTYSKQAVYPVPPLGPYSTEKPLIYVMANSSFDQGLSADPSKIPTQISHNQFNPKPLTSYTQYENESIPPPPAPSVISLQKHQQSSAESDHHQQQQPSQPTQQVNLNDLALTEPLSQVLAEANAKAGEAMDKTIRFVIHKPEDEDVVKNAILEDAQNRYEDVKFVQGPTLKVQRKETVYLPPKKKTVVYILLKEPQIDTDVEVMSPQEDEPAPEVYITYQKSDGAVKTKHYSPKPIREEDMKRYINIEEDSAYGSGEESRIHPRFSKSTSVSLSTSSKVSRKSVTTSSSSIPEVASNKGSVNSSESSVNSTSNLANHNLSASSANDTASLKDFSPLLYTQRNFPPIKISNSTSSVRLPRKKPRSSDFQQILPLPRRILRHFPVQCPTVK